MVDFLTPAFSGWKDMNFYGMHLPNDSLFLRVNIYDSQQLIFLSKHFFDPRRFLPELGWKKKKAGIYKALGKLRTELHPIRMEMNLEWDKECHPSRNMGLEHKLPLTQCVDQAEASTALTILIALSSSLNRYAKISRPAKGWLQVFFTATLDRRFAAHLVQVQVPNEALPGCGHDAGRDGRCDHLVMVEDRLVEVASGSDSSPKKLAEQLCTLFEFRGAC